MSGQIKVKLIKSVIGTPKSHRDTVKALGLRKVNSEVLLSNEKEILGMINKVSYLLKVEK